MAPSLSPFMTRGMRSVQDDAIFIPQYFSHRFPSPRPPLPSAVLPFPPGVRTMQLQGASSAYHAQQQGQQQQPPHHHHSSSAEGLAWNQLLQQADAASGGHAGPGVAAPVDRGDETAAAGGGRVSAGVPTMLPSTPFGSAGAGLAIPAASIPQQLPQPPPPPQQQQQQQPQQRSMPMPPPPSLMSCFEAHHAAAAAAGDGGGGSTEPSLRDLLMDRQWPPQGAPPPAVLHDAPMVESST